ncbi:MAG: ABC-F family ATP-binding cassette domain-containing protein [Rhodobiaceae bacterium]|nr:ABC-F family ATP-binding cassette domain-containing protein [Rhodobiaceae bacterium]MCC0013418.1 ABC-F family ATP-binding cassette domain-containing protein [Rhodobiaceae bacterium]MCC0018229.1 ABC-F family ATP-binding cassette domain-containing protein [Rhodobiaceae bacterium]MCC0050826.1 ABC-F family ATP-binding cassette domain-containing protein [Rhodobiaceae bacterium]MCC0060529.1 ABC-F family ATP-binding cassette domain-containing protein [Rhodobiaceae bacterium]
MLHVNDLTYRIGARVLLDHATVALPDGARAGLVGRNGTGKSTLLRILLGELSAESGGVMLPRGARIGTVDQEAPDGPQTLIDFVLDADTERKALLEEAETATDPHRIAEVQTRLADIDAHAAPARAARILSGLGFDEAAQQRPLSTYSGGWRMRVALAAILFAEPDILLLDEPTNYLDLEGTLWLQSYLAKYPRTVVIVSHDRDLLNTSVDTIVHLDRGKLTAYRGGYDQFERQRAEAQALQMKLKKKQDDQRRHMEAFVERFRYKASKARQAQSRLKALERLQPIAAMVDDTMVPIHLTGPEKQLAAPIVALDKASAGYSAGQPVLEGIDLRIDPDDRIGLLGANGNGKSTLAKVISGRLDVMDGRLKRSDKLTVGYFAQHQLDEINPAQSAYQLLRELMTDQSEARVRARAGALGFPGQKADTPARDLSGGEKARLLLGLATFHQPHLLILDEPTNHLDVDAREALVQAINEYSGAVILISHDKHLLETSVDRLWLVANGTVKPYDGDVDDYRRLVLEAAGLARRAGKDDKASRDPKADRRKVTADQRNALLPLREDIKAKEKRMTQLAAGIAKLDAALSEPGLFERNPKRGAELSKLRAEAERSLIKTEEEWLDASAALEEAEQNESV